MTLLLSSQPPCCAATVKKSILYPEEESLPFMVSKVKGMTKMHGKLVLGEIGDPAQALAGGPTPGMSHFLRRPCVNQVCAVSVLPETTEAPMW